MMAGTFELKNDASGGYRFNLHASKGEIIATSESYTTQTAAPDGMHAVRANAADAQPRSLNQAV